MFYIVMGVAILGSGCGGGTGLRAPDADRDGVSAAVDCDDGDPATGGPGRWFEDRDGDRVGAAEVVSCGGPALVAEGGDCADDDPAVHPGAVDVPCNGVDDDCRAATADRPALVAFDSESIDGSELCGVRVASAR